MLELRQYKNGFVSVKRMLALKLPCRLGIKGGNFKTNMFLTEKSPFLYCLSSRSITKPSMETPKLFFWYNMDLQGFYDNLIFLRVSL